MAVPHSVHREAGAVRIDPAACTACGRCAGICPTGVLEIADGKLRARDDTPLGCIACGHCMMVCPEGAVAVNGRGLSPDDLVPLPPPAARAGPDALAALLLARRSVRRFRDEDLDDHELDRIVEAAATAPMGIPPWDVGVVLVRGREQVRRLSLRIVSAYERMLKLLRPWVLAAMRPFVGRAAQERFRHFIVPLAETYVRARARGEDGLFYGAPAVLLFHHSPYADPVDAAIACTYAMLAAEAAGLGTTMIGAAAPILARDRALCRRLGIPAGHAPAIVLVVGRPAVAFRRAIRRRFASVARVG